MPKILLFSLALAAIILTGIITVVYNSALSKTPPKSEVDIAINQARVVFLQAKESGKNFSNGPCLSNALQPGWVLDIVHSPRLPIDDLPENQCSAFGEGRAEHFVELDPEGNFIRAR